MLIIIQKYILCLINFILYSRIFILIVSLSILEIFIIIHPLINYLKKIGCFLKHISENDLLSIILHTLAGPMILESGVLTHFSKNSRDTSPL